MRYRSKLLLAFLGLAIITSGLLFLLTVRTSREALRNQIRSTVLTVAVTAADRIDATLHEQIQTEDDMSSPAYQTIERELRRVRDANRRDDLHIAFVYTMRRVPGEWDKWVYVVDGAEPGEDKSTVNEVIEWESQGDPDDEPLVLGPAYADEQIVTDEYGVWLSAYAPIIGADGRPVAMVGVDLRADDLKAKLNFLLFSSLIALGFAIIAAAVLSFLFAYWATAPIRTVVAAVQRIGRGRFETRLPEGGGDEFGTLARAVNEMADSLQERNALKGALSRYVSADAASQLVEEKKIPLLLEGNRRQVTVLVSDIKNIGRLAKTLSPERLVKLLNEYFESMVEIVFRYHGTIERRLGDQLIAVFGAPFDDESKERNAVHAAVAMRTEQRRLNEEWGLTGDERFVCGAGIHTGDAVIGNIGSGGDVELTVVGEPVDIAASIKDLNAKYKTTGLVSEVTVAPIKDEFGFVEVGEVQPSLGELIRLYTLTSFREAI